jgi:RNA polymerase sigma-70 factor (ECF subfamily)
MTAPPDGSETQLLINRAAHGDAAARAELLDRYRQPLRRMVAIRMDRRIAARVDPSDVVQEAMKDAHARLPEYLAQPQLAFYPWLRRIAWDRLVDMYRTHLGAERRSVLKEEGDAPPLNDESVVQLAQRLVTNSTNPGQRVMLAELQARTKLALAQLKPHDREILVLRYLEQLGVDEIAAVLNISATAVTSRHLRAVQRLRRLLGPTFGE